MLYLDNNPATMAFLRNSRALFAGSPSSSSKYWPQPEGPQPFPGEHSGSSQGEPAPISHGQRGSDPEFDGLRLSNAEIARRLQIAEGTVKWHTNRLFKKLEVENRTQAVRPELGLLELQSPRLD